MSFTDTKAKYIGFMFSLIDWFNFAIYAALITKMGEIFFPSNDQYISLLGSFSTFAVAYIFRPIGAYFFGKISDSKGEIISLRYTVLLISISTGIICLLPTQASIIKFSTTLLIIARALQGFAMGGCYGISYVYVISRASQNKKNLAAAFVCLGFMLGFISGNATVGIIYNAMENTNFSYLAWRVPFVLGTIAAMAMYLILLKIPAEKTISQQVCEKTVCEKMFDVKQLLKFIKTIIVIGLDMAGFYFIFVFKTNFLIMLGYSQGYVSLLNTYLMILLCFSIIGFGWLADKIKEINVLIISCIALMLLAHIFPGEGIYSYLLTLLALGACYGALPYWVVSQYPGQHTSYYTGLAFNLSSALFASTTPFISTALAKYNILYLKIYIASFALIILILLLNEKFFSKNKTLEHNS